MVVGFPAGDGIAHHMVNRSEKPATYLVISNRHPDDGASYADIDLAGFVHRYSSR